MLVAGTIGSLLGGLAFYGLGDGLGALILLVLMFAGGLGTAVVASVVLELDDDLGAAATIAVVVGLMPGAPLTAYLLRGTGGSVEVSSAADAIAKRDARYFHIAAPRPDAARAVVRRYKKRVSSKGSSSKTYLEFDVLTPIADAGERPRVFVLHESVYSVRVPASEPAAEARARARYRHLIAKTGPWFRRTKAWSGQRDVVQRAAGSEPWLFLEPVASPERDRFRRSIWLWLLAGVATVAVGAYAFATRFAPLEKRDEKKQGPYR